MNDRARESELIARAVSGDGDAFAELVQPFEAKVYNLACRMCGSREDAYDLAQEAFLKVYRALGRFKGDSSFSTWLYRVVANTCLDQIRRTRRSRAVLSLDAPVDTEGGSLRREPADASFDPEDAALRAEVQREVRAVVLQLAPDHRLAIVLRDFEDFSYEEIADTLGKSEGAIRVIQHRALRQLKKLIEEA